MMKGHNIQNDAQEKKCTQQYMQKKCATISSELATNIQESDCEIFSAKLLMISAQCCAAIKSKTRI